LRVCPFKKLLPKPNQSLAKTKSGAIRVQYQASRESGLDEMAKPTVAGRVPCSRAYAIPSCCHFIVLSRMWRSSGARQSVEGVGLPGSSVSMLTILVSKYSKPVWSSAV
jgi:hypothetical protein